MGIHDEYGKQLLRAVVGSHFVDSGQQVEVIYEGGTRARIDGVVRDFCAVEIESRTDKQVRGALVDLLFHELPLKLLVIIPAHMHDPEATVKQCEGILGSLSKPGSKAMVVLLTGTGHLPSHEADRRRIQQALRGLGWSSQE